MCVTDTEGLDREVWAKVGPAQSGYVCLDCSYASKNKAQCPVQRPFLFYFQSALTIGVGLNSQELDMLPLRRKVLRYYFFLLFF